MSYQESKSLVTMVSGVLVFVVYFVIVWGRYRGLDVAAATNTDELLRFWATAMLVLIPISIVVRIIIMIIFSIIYRIATGEDPPEIEDERDKLIELKINQVAQALFIFGFIGSMVPIVAGGTVTTMFVILMVSGVFSEMVSETARIVMYRVGV